MTKSGMVVAREACVVVVGAEPAKYEQITVLNRLGQSVTMNKDQPYEDAKDGIPYAFKPYQKVPKNHAAVKASPSSFVDIEDLTDGEQEMVSK